MFSRLQSWFNMLRSDPVGFIVYLLYLVVTVLLSLILHEIAHGYVAYRCGDPTAKMFGRLSLDPRKHLDPLGTICMFVFGIGWAKPVPVNPRNFRNYRRDDFLVSIAGIVMNLTLFILTTALAVGVNGLMFDRSFLADIKDYYGSLDLLLNPYSSSVGTAITYGLTTSDMTSVMAHPWLMYVQRFLLNMATINLSLAVFNLLPIPPLDGSKVLAAVLPDRQYNWLMRYERFGMLIIMALVCFGALSNVLNTAIGAVFQLFCRIVGFY